jgi:hypothetical protein
MKTILAVIAPLVVAFAVFFYGCDQEESSTVEKQERSGPNPRQSACLRQSPRPHRNPLWHPHRPTLWAHRLPPPYQSPRQSLPLHRCQTTNNA